MKCSLREGYFLNGECHWLTLWLLELEMISSAICCLLLDGWILNAWCHKRHSFSWGQKDFCFFCNLEDFSINLHLQFFWMNHFAKYCSCLRISWNCLCVNFNYCLRCAIYMRNCGSSHACKSFFTLFVLFSLERSSAFLCWRRGWIFSHE